MYLKKVRNHKELKIFLQLPGLINENDPNWVKPLDNDILAVFDPAANKLIEHGDIEKWLLWDGKEAVGRIVAFINPETSFKENIAVGGIGFFDCFNDQKISTWLFEAAKAWLKAREMEAMDGPINFGRKDRWWGLLVENNMPPSYGMNYNQPYYANLFEAFEFHPYYFQYTYNINVANRNLNHSIENTLFQVKHFNSTQIEEFVLFFIEAYNNSWKHKKRIQKLNYETALTFFKSIADFQKEEFIWIGFYNKVPVAYFILMPDLNQFINENNGKLTNRLKRKIGEQIAGKEGNKLLCLGLGMELKYREQGFDLALINKALSYLKNNTSYSDIETSWIGDFSVSLINMMDSIGAVKIKTHITYRKLFDPSWEFQRAPIEVI